MNFVGLHTSLTAIRASQIGLDTASHNIANAGTEGYTRQRVDQVAQAAWQSPVGAIGEGVDVAKISRSRDDFLDRRVRGAEADAARQSTRASFMGRAEMITGEPDYGVSGELTAVWDAFEEMANEPSEGAGRQQAVAAMASLTARVRQVRDGWDDLAADAASQAATTVQEVNTMLQRVGRLNSDIPVAAYRGEPNDLLDERDLLLDKLSAAVGATSVANTDGTVTVTVGGRPVVSNVTVSPLSVGGAPNHTISAGGQALVPGGTLGGLQQFLTTDLATHRTALNNLASDLATELNARNAAGFDQGGAPGAPLLSFDPARGAGSLQVAAAVAADPRRIAAAGSLPVKAQDGSNATRLANLRSDAIGGATFDNRVRQSTVALAGDVSALERSADAAEGLRVTASSARSSVSSVSLDEELVAVVQYQRSLEAATRVMSAVDQALDALINRTGMVGR